jgi:DNA polymerase IIIc chi subunit
MKDKLEVSFYHFTVTPLIVGLPRLIKKIYSTKQNLLVVSKTEESMNELNRVLWTFSPKEFIPHGTIHEENVNLQPVLLSTDARNNGNASEIVLELDATSHSVIPAEAWIQYNKNDGMVNGDSVRFKKYLYAFYGNQDEVTHMVDSYQKCKNRDDITAVFWKQDHDGKWSNAM